MKIFNLVTVFALLLTVNTFAQFGVRKDLININTYQSFDKVYKGAEFKLAVEVSVAEGWHINSNKPYDDYLIPTQLTIVDNPTFRLKKVVYPKPHDYKFSFSESPLSVWEGTVFKGALIEVDSNAVPGIYKLVVKLQYQACNEMSCNAPTSIMDTINVEVADNTTPVNSINEEKFVNIDLSLTTPATDAKVGSDPISNALESNGLLLGLLLVFVGGLALNLTPCVYPLIPITVGYFGGQSEGSTTKLFFMGVLFI